MKAIALMQFGAEFNDVFNTLRRACEESIRTSNLADGRPQANSKSAAPILERVDDALNAASEIVAKITRKIQSCDFCIADITGNNPNVMWELGFAMALEKPVFIVSQDRNSIAFDLRNVSNLEYKRDDLENSLQKPLVTKIAAALADFSTAPRIRDCAEAMASTSGSPTYFLDANYVIRYMNEAAGILFTSSDGFFNSRKWIGRTLREFMNDFSHNLLNLPAIEKNLQAQGEEIQNLIREGRADAICDYNIERIILDSPVYGEVELQKTGVAVRNPVSKMIVGWVVTFNLVRSANPKAYEHFHRKHQNFVEAQFAHEWVGPDQPLSPVPAPDGPVWPDGPEVRQWISRGCKSPFFHIAKDYAEKQACFDFCAAVMKFDKSRYGLQSVRYLNEWFFDYHHADFIVMKPTEAGDCVAVFRIHYDHDVTQYSGIEEWVLANAKDGQTFADVGAYIHPQIEGGSRANVLASMLGWACRLSESKNQTHLYAQVPSGLAAHFKRFLFRQAGTKFACKGWSQLRWTPMVLKCIAYPNFDGEAGALPTPENIGGPEEMLVDRDFIVTAAAAYRDPRIGGTLV